MRIVFLGTRGFSGSDAARMPLSFAVEFRCELYFFDAGEGCATAAESAGLELVSTRGVFITDKRISRASGLGNLLHSVCASRGARNDDTPHLYIPVYIDSRPVYDGIIQMVNAFNGNAADSPFNYHRISETEIYRDDHLAVAFHPLESPPGAPASNSHSLRISTSSGTIFYMPELSETGQLPSRLTGTDLLVIGADENNLEPLCSGLQNGGMDFTHLIFINNGRSCFSNPDASLKFARATLGDRVSLAEEGQTAHLTGARCGERARIIFDEGMDTIAQKALHLIRKNRGYLSVCEAARLCGVSAATLERHFHAALGAGFASYSLRYRLEGAAEDILNSDMPLKCVAKKWGFSNVSHLCNKFTAHFGCNTTEYRRRFSPDSHDTDDSKDAS